MVDAGVISYLRSCYDGSGGFRFSGSRPNLYATCWAASCCDLIRFQGVEEIDRAAVAATLRSYQDEESGLFFDPELVENKTSSHDTAYIRHQITDFCLSALSALGLQPQHPLRFLGEYKNTDRLESFLSGLNWSDPWYASNEVMFVLNFLLYERAAGIDANEAPVRFIIDWLTEHQDPHTGYWSLGRRSTLHNQMAGAYHFLFFYTWLGITPRYQERVIDSTLLLQDHDGLFCYAGGGGSCEDLDAVDLLCRATFYTGHRRDDIVCALKKTYRALLDNQNADGGFCWAKRDFLSPAKILRVFGLRLLLKGYKDDFVLNARSKIGNQKMVLLHPDKLVWRYSGLSTMERRLSESDPWSTYFRLLAIAFIERTFPEIAGGKTSFDWNFRGTAGLGYYR